MNGMGEWAEAIGMNVELNEEDNSVEFTLQLPNDQSIRLKFKPPERFITMCDVLANIRVPFMLRIQQLEMLHKREAEESIREMEVDLGLAHEPTNEEVIEGFEKKIGDMLNPENPPGDEDE